MTRNTKFAFQQFTKEILGLLGRGILWLRAWRRRRVVRRAGEHLLMALGSTGLAEEDGPLSTPEFRRMKSPIDEEVGAEYMSCRHRGP